MPFLQGKCEEYFEPLQPNVAPFVTSLTMRFVTCRLTIHINILKYTSRNSSLCQKLLLQIFFVTVTFLDRRLFVSVHVF